MHICDNCNKKFSSKQRLNYHKNNKVCIDKKIVCGFCEKTYKTKYTFLRHLNKKHHMIENKKNNELTCKKCNIIFTRKYNLQRHINNNKCINNTNNINNIINNITNNNIINNITNNITINNFGKESFVSISDDQLHRCINMCYKGIPALFKLIHIDTPENRNLYLTNIKNPYIYTYSNNKWNLNEIKLVLSYLQREKKELIEYYVENNSDKFNKYKIKNINKMLNEHKNGILDKQYNSELKMLLINNKNVLKKTYDILN